jgi:hypothetical protein
MIFCDRKRMIFYRNQALARLICGKSRPLGWDILKEAIWCGFTLRRATGDNRLAAVLLAR